MNSWSKPQQRMRDLVQQALQDAGVASRFRLSENVRLCDVARLDHTGALSGGWRSMYMQGHVDLAVIDVTQGQWGTPVLALEYDSPYHADEVQSRRDLKKNTLLAAAGIPLTRITKDLIRGTAYSPSWLYAMIFAAFADDWAPMPGEGRIMLAFGDMDMSNYGLDAATSLTGDMTLYIEVHPFFYVEEGARPTAASPERYSAFADTCVTMTSTGQRVASRVEAPRLMGLPVLKRDWWSGTEPLKIGRHHAGCLAEDFLTRLLRMRSLGAVLAAYDAVSFNPYTESDPTDYIRSVERAGGHLIDPADAWTGPRHELMVPV